MKLVPWTLIDGYKLDHRRQYPPGTTRVYSNWTPRGSRLPGNNGAIFFGLQAFLQHYLMDRMQPFFFHANIDRVCDRVRAEGQRVPRSSGCPKPTARDELDAILRASYLHALSR